jgi:hypothetical protein
LRIATAPQAVAVRQALGRAEASAAQFDSVRQALVELGSLDTSSTPEERLQLDEVPLESRRDARPGVAFRLGLAVTLQHVDEQGQFLRPPLEVRPALLGDP